MRMQVGFYSYLGFLFWFWFVFARFFFVFVGELESPDACATGALWNFSFLVSYSGDFDRERGRL
jgi:hypothetical protein